jgi:hypothetical protein
MIGMAGFVRFPSHPVPMTQMLRAGVVAATLSGAPSTVHALLTGLDPLAATRAAGTLIRPAGSPPLQLVAAGAFAHLAISAWWTTVLTRVLPLRRPALEGAVAGLAIAALDLGLVGRKKRAIADLPLLPQVADHVLFGILVARVLAARSRPRAELSA